MKKIKDYLQQKREVVFSCGLNIAALLLSVLVFKPFLEENDDAFISMISEGAYGTRDYHLIYVNGILGKITVFLNSVVPGIRWHCILQYIFIFLGMSGITYILIKHTGKQLYGYILVFSLTYELYVSLQYSKSAVFVTAAGYILLIHCCREYNSNRKAFKLELLAYMLLLYGMLLRDSSFYLATLGMCIFAVYEIIKLCKSSNNYCTFLKSAKTYIFRFIPVLIVLVCTIYVNKAMYASSSGWSEFMDYNSARMDLLDYRYDLLDYNAYGQELKENGISENDAIIYLTWQFGDDNVLNTEALKSIVETGNKKKVDISLIKAFAADIFKECFRISPLIISLIFIYVILILRCRNNPLEGSFVFTFVAASILLLAGILFYYEYSGRFSHRIVYALFICIFTFGIMVLSDSDNIPEENVDIDSSGIIVVISICVFLNIGLLLGNRFDYEAYKREMPDYKGVFSEMDNNRDKLFVADTFTFQEAYKYDVFKSFGLGSLDNFVAVGSWYVNSPITRSILSQYGYSNPYEALGENDVNVVLVDNCYPEEKAKFLGEHYNGDYFAEELTDCFEADYGFNYYRMVH